MAFEAPIYARFDELPAGTPVAGSLFVTWVDGQPCKTTLQVAGAALAPYIAGAGGTATANTVYAGPTTGAAAAPAFRALVSADLPATLAITNLDAGASGTAGTVDVFPATAARGKIAIVAANNAGDTITTITNASQAGARTYTIPDAGASASFVMTAGAQTFAGLQTFTTGVSTENLKLMASAVVGGQLYVSGTTVLLRNAADNDYIDFDIRNLFARGNATVYGGLFMGASGDAGQIYIFPATAAMGYVAISAANNAGNTETSWVFGAQAAARTYTVPDAGGDAKVDLSGVQAVSADGAITITSGLAAITKAGVAVITLAAPTATVDDGKQLRIMATTAHAHTVTQASPGFDNGGGGADVATFGGAVGDNIVVEAYQGVWYVRSTRNVTLG